MLFFNLWLSNQINSSLDSACCVVAFDCVVVVSQSVSEMGVSPGVDLPVPSANLRWVISRKAQLIAALDAGWLSLEEACSRYSLTSEEIISWRSRMIRHGMRGLRATGIQQYTPDWPRASHS